MQVLTWQKLISVGWDICTVVEKYVLVGRMSGMIKKKQWPYVFLSKYMLSLSEFIIVELVNVRTCLGKSLFSMFRTVSVRIFFFFFVANLTHLSKYILEESEIPHYQYFLKSK